MQNGRFVTVCLPFAQLIQPVEPFDYQPDHHCTERNKPEAAHHHQRADQGRGYRQPGMVVQHFRKIVCRIQYGIRPVRPQPGRDKDIEVTDNRRQPLELNFVVVIQQQAEVFPRREGIAGQIEERKTPLPR